MRALLATLAGRRAALLERSARQRREVAVAAADMRRAAAEPLYLGAAAAVTLLGASPRLRVWFVRAWVIGAFVRRLLAR